MTHIHWVGRQNKLEIKVGAQSSLCWIVQIQYSKVQWIHDACVDEKLMGKFCFEQNQRRKKRKKIPAGFFFFKNLKKFQQLCSGRTKLREAENCCPRPIWVSDFHSGTKKPVGSRVGNLTAFLLHRGPCGTVWRCVVKSAVSVVIMTVGPCAPPSLKNRTTSCFYFFCKVDFLSHCPIHIIQSCSLFTTEIKKFSFARI